MVPLLRQVHLRWLVVDEPRGGGGARAAHCGGEEGEDAARGGSVELRAVVGGERVDGFRECCWGMSRDEVLRF